MTDHIGEVLRKLRTSYNYTQIYTSEFVGVDTGTYSRYESGKTEPGIETIKKLSELYKMTVDQLIHYGDPDYNINEPKEIYLKKWTVPVTVALDGTEETLQMWFNKLTAINAAI